MRLSSIKYGSCPPPPVGSSKRASVNRRIRAISPQSRSARSQAQEREEELRVTAPPTLEEQVRADGRWRR